MLSDAWFTTPVSVSGGEFCLISGEFTVLTRDREKEISGSGSATEQRMAGSQNMKYSGEKPARGAPAIISRDQTISFENILLNLTERRIMAIFISPLPQNHL